MTPLAVQGSGSGFQFDVFGGTEYRWESLPAVEVFVELALQSRHSALGLSHYVRVYDAWHKSPPDKPEIPRFLRWLGTQPGCTQALDFFCLSLSTADGFAQHCPVDSLAGLGVVPRAVGNSFVALRAGREDLVVESLARAVTLSDRPEALWIVLKSAVFCLNKLGRHALAQEGSLLAYEIASALGAEALVQRSRFAVLWSTRLTQNANISFEYLKQVEGLHSATLRFEQRNQALLPCYAAMHLIDRGVHSEHLPGLRGLARELECCDYTLSCGAFLESRMLLSDGRRGAALSRLHEAWEMAWGCGTEYAWAGEMAAFCRRLGVDLPRPSGVEIVPAPPLLLNKLEVGIRQQSQRLSISARDD